MSDIDELLSKIKLDMQSLKVNTQDYSSPKHYRWYGEILVPSNWNGGMLDYIHNLTHYHMDNLPPEAISDFYGLDIIHGHTTDRQCYAPCFCHLYGYWPEATNSPRFVRQFEKKWKKLYEERGWNINGN